MTSFDLTPLLAPGLPPPAIKWIGYPLYPSEPLACGSFSQRHTPKSRFVILCGS